jgi:hypothetical protein
MEPNMGISKEDELKLIENVNIVFHSAATVRFDEPLKFVLYKFFNYLNKKMSDFVFH